MAQEKKITKVSITVLMEMEDFVKAKRILGKPGESKSELIQHIIHDLVKDVPLQQKEIEFLQEYYKEQRAKRMMEREKKLLKTNTL